MRVDVTDLVGRKIRRLRRRRHGRDCGNALRVRLRQVMRIVGRAIADNLAKNICATFARGVE
jgi:hypothetical protein